MTNDRYAQVLNDIELDASAKFYRRCAELAYDAIADDVEGFAENLASQYFPDADPEDDEFVENFINPLLDKITDAVKENF